MTNNNILQIKIYYCSFCGRKNDQVEYIISATTSVNICNECVDSCKEAIERKKNANSK